MQHPAISNAIALAVDYRFLDNFVGVTLVRLHRKHQRQRYLGTGATSVNDISAVDRPRFRATRPVELLETQRSVVRLLIQNLARIALSLPSSEQRPPVRPRDDVDRPHQVFCIDGARGTGKTYTLLSIAHLLEALNQSSAGDQWHVLAADKSTWVGFVRDVIGDGAFRRLFALDRKTKMSETIRIIFPGQMESHESLMMSVFAEISNSIKCYVEDKAGRIVSSDAEMDAIKPGSSQLREKLLVEVETLWWFSRNLGAEIISNDSASYDDFAKKYDTLARKSVLRIEWWRKFLNAYLDHIDSDFLVILIDDSDTNPDLTSDLLHSIRMYLNHPRVVTILAGNTRTIRSTLVHPAMADLGQAMEALSTKTSMTANDWRRNARKGSEEYLDKVVPTQNRFYLKPSIVQEDLGAVDGGGILQHRDFQKITGQSLFELSYDIMKGLRAEFLRIKYRHAVRYALNLSDVPISTEKAILENFLSWWTFSYRYAGTLSPQSPRQITSFKNYFVRRDGEVIPTLRTKRLTIALFESSSNYSLLQQFNDYDPNVTTWLQNQTVSSRWVGQRLFQINGRDFNRNSYSYDYLQFRLDVGLAMPIRHNAEEAVPPGILPHLNGRKYLRRFFQPQRMPRRHRRLGISRWVDHAAVPGNCLYFNDLQAIPNISLAEVPSPEIQNGSWEARLAHNWVDVVEDGQSELSYRYFTEVACAGLRNTADIASSEFLRLLDPPTIARQQHEALFEHFLEDELSAFGQDLPEIDWRTDLATLDTAPQLALRRKRRRVALYACLVTDLRRAWHAIRIFESSPPRPGAAIGSGLGMHAYTADEGASFAVIATHDRLRLYTYQQIERALKSSSWARVQFDVFSYENIQRVIGKIPEMIHDTKCLDAWQRFQNEAKVRPEDFSRIFPTAQVQISNSQAWPIFDEYQDFRDWTRTLRSLGRLSSAEWRDFGDSDPDQPRLSPEDLVSTHKMLNQLNFVENALFLNEKTWCEYHLSVSEPEDENGKQIQRENARAARNFLWLIYGLAPSLPAVIHVNIMGKIYHATLNEQGLVDSTESVGSKAARQDMARQVDALYQQALAEIDLWGRLVGSVAAILRYIRVKIIHLHLGFAIQAVEGTPKHGADVQKYTKELLISCGIPEDQHKTSRDNLFRLFVGDHPLAQDLAMMPDVASSTLFGDKWITDTILSVKNFGLIQGPGSLSTDFEPGGGIRTELGSSEGANPLEINGVFAETEQWLWASVRALGKIKVAVSRRQAMWENRKI